MSVKKQYMKSKNVCKVTFTLPAGETGEMATVVGDFNGWDREATPMKKSRSGYSVTVELEPGREYQFRYLIDGERWANDDEADSMSDTHFHDAKNCVIVA